jgi:N-formylglutamate deformylase
VIPRVVANGREIRTGKMTMVEAHQRLDRYYFPYHDKLADLLNQSHSMFGFAVLLDCHSMPHEALAVTSYAYDKKPEIVLGDRFGAACLPDLIEAVDEIFTAAGLRVSRNLPFAGAHVTQKYGRPSRGQHALQIEIDRSIYMDEAAMRPNDDFAEICAMLRNVVAELTELGRGALQHAAE